MARLFLMVFAVSFLVSVLCKPTKEVFEGNAVSQPIPQRLAAPRLWKRFINPSYAAGGFADAAPDDKMRMRRSTEDECERLQLCKLHARSGHSLLASFQLYFVNKENAKLWDHQAHSAADCERRYSSCHGNQSPDTAPERAPGRRQQYRFVDYDYS